MCVRARVRGPYFSAPTTLTLVKVHSSSLLARTRAHARAATQLPRFHVRGRALHASRTPPSQSLRCMPPPGEPVQAAVLILASTPPPPSTTPGQGIGAVLEYFTWNCYYQS
jgi:hypothetical protein